MVMSCSRRFAPVGALALLSSIACSSVGVQGVPAAPAPAAALTQPAVVPASVPVRPVGGQGAPSETERQAAPSRARPLAVINEMLTAQALLVSLLLAPMSKDGGELARVDATPDPSGSPVR
jgi:hypothetical protein